MASKWPALLFLKSLFPEHLQKTNRSMEVPTPPILLSFSSWQGAIYWCALSPLEGKLHKNYTFALKSPEPRTVSVTK